ncbi:MAG: DNA repair protein RecO [Endomicrobiia bacterium]
MYSLVRGFVLDRKNTAEYDKLVTIYTLEYGKIKVFFKSVNKLTSKFISSTEIATELELQILHTKNINYGEIFRFAGGRVLNYNQSLRENLEIYKYTAKVLELVNALTMEGAKDESKYFLVKRILEVLPLYKNYEILYLAFVFRFIKLCGYMPEIKKCVKCGRRLFHEESNNKNEIYCFDFIEKGIICSICEKSLRIVNSKMFVSFDLLFTLHKFFKLNAEEVNLLNVDKKTLDEILKFTFIYLQDFLHIPLKTWSISYENKIYNISRNNNHT